MVYVFSQRQESARNGEQDNFSHEWKWKTADENGAIILAIPLLKLPIVPERLYPCWHLPRTVRLVAKTRGGCVDTWHMYKPPSSFLIGLICRRQLFGYWNLTLILGSPLYVLLPTVRRDTLSVVLRIHITWFLGLRLSREKDRDEKRKWDKRQNSKLRCIGQ